MLCFKDRTFCCSKAHKPNCDRQWTPQLQEEAERWWKGPNPPVAFSDFCSEGSNNESR